MRTRRRVVLKQSQQLDLQPGNRNLVVNVVRRVLVLDDDLSRWFRQPRFFGETDWERTLLRRSTAFW